MNRRDALKIGAVVPLTMIPYAEAADPKSTEYFVPLPESQDVLLLMNIKTWSRLVNLLDESKYLDEEIPFIEKGERVNDTYVVTWFEWNSLHDKLKWEEILNEVV